MMKTQKQVIPYAELLSMLNGILARFPEECRNIHIDGIETYPEQVDGANWHISWIRRSGNDNDLLACQNAINAKVRELRAHFDVESGGK